MSKADEQVLCKWVTDPEYFIPSMKMLQNGENYSWQKRIDCETDEQYKQLIPYVVLYDIKKDVYLGYYRKAGDARLLGSLSIGVGGHINPCDSSQGNSIISTYPMVLNNINRELSEELGTRYTPPYDWWSYFRGFIYDPSTSVGKVHVGLLFLRHMNLDSTWEFEDNEHIFKLVTHEQLLDSYSGLETWSQIATDLITKKTNDKFYRSLHALQ